MGGFNSNQRRQRGRNAAGGSPNPRPGGRGAHENQPQVLTLGSQRVHYRQNPGGPVVFYVDRQQQEAPPSEVQETVKIKNHVNLLKESLTVVPAHDHLTFSISFKVDSLVEAECTIYYAALESWDEVQGLHFIPQNPRLPHCVQGPMRLPAETGQVVLGPQLIDFDDYGALLVADELSPLKIPIVIALRYEVPQASDITTGTPTFQTQFTYCQLGDSDVLQLKAVKQRLQVADLSVFELEDIYGIGGPAPATAVTDEALAAAAMYGDVEIEGDECVICMANERDTTVMPCRHMCLCGDCAEVLRRQTNKCPICRTIIECLMTLKKEKTSP